MSINRSRRSVALGAVALATAALVLTACTGRGDAAPPAAGDGSDAPADTSPIVIGASWPQSGPLAAVSPGLAGFEAYIEQVNADGGVNGRPIELLTADDAYDPARLVENQRSFAEEGAVAVINFGGIAIAGREHLKSVGIAGFTLAGNTPMSDVENFPLSRAWWPDVMWEGQAQAEWILENNPDASVGLVGLNNDLTDSQVQGLEAGGVELTQVAPIPPGTADVSATLTEFQAAGIDTVVLAVGAPTLGSAMGFMDQIGWEPTIIVNSTMADFHTLVLPAGPEVVEGTYSFQFGKDPSDPAFAEDADVTAYLDAMEQTGHADASANAVALNGYGLAAALVSAIEASGDATSESIIEAWDAMDGVENPFLRDGLTLKAAPGGRVIGGYQLARFDGTTWVPEGELVTLEDLGIQ